MTASHYAEGVLLCALFTACVAVVSICVRKRLLSAWHGAPARLAEVVIGISTVVVVSQALGTVGLFGAFPLLETLAALSLLLLLWERRRGPDAARGPGRLSQTWSIAPGRKEAPWEPVLAVLASGLVVAEWSTGTIDALRSGVAGIDTIWYHMPFAAQFAQTGSVIAPHNINNDNVIEFYPATSELLHAVGIVLLGSDFLSTLANLAWLLFALFAAWCLGRRYGVGSISIVATAMVLGTAQVIGSQPGSSYNDVVGVALLLAAFGILAYVDGLWSDCGSQGLWVAALAAGLALGVKDTLIIPVAALTLGVIVLLPRGRRWRQSVIWCLALLATGGYWYGRNLFYAGNPVPNVRLGFGPFRLPTSPGTIGPTMSRFLTNEQLWKLYFIPGLKEDLGPAWWASVVIALVGLMVGVAALMRTVGSKVRKATTSGPGATSRATSVHSFRGHDAMAGLLAFVGLATLVGYIVTPQPRLPTSFVYDFRFTLFSFVAGAIALPIACGRWRWVWVFLPTYGAVLVASQFAGGIWSGPSTVPPSVGDALLLGLPVVVIGLGLMVVLRFGSQWFVRTALSAFVVLLAVAVGAGFPLQNFYVSHWDTEGPYPTIARWASTVHRARIGVSPGGFLSYPLYGSDLSNDVDYMATPGPHGTYTNIATCAAWRRAINDERFQFVVTVRDYARKIPPSITWTRSDPVSKLVVSEVTLATDGFSQISVYAIDGTMSASTCPR